MKAASDSQPVFKLMVFVQASRLDEAASFYQAALGAMPGKRHWNGNVLLGIDMTIGEHMLSIAGANPNREAEPWRGGPFFLKADGAGSTVFCLDVLDAQAALRKALDTGAKLRDALETMTDGRRGAAFFDPFGHIWSVHEKHVSLAARAA